MQDLVLGTAQWGSAYGATNRHGRLSDARIEEIVDLARSIGIRYVDTAAGYGDAQSRLRPWAAQFLVTTKVRGAAPESILGQVAASLDALGVDHVHGCLVHDWSSLTDVEAARTASDLESLRTAGVVDHVGVSVYDEADLVRALAHFVRVDAAQVPINALDRRLVHSPTLAAMARGGTDIQARSVFLQGLMAERSGSGLGRHPDVLAFHDWCEARGLSPVQAAVDFVRRSRWIAKVVVGVTGSGELREIASAWAGSLTYGDEPGPGSEDLDLIDPRRWS